MDARWNFLCDGGITDLALDRDRLLFAKRPGQVLARASVDTANLSRAIDEHLNGILRIIDQTLLIIKRDYEKDPAGFDATTQLREIPLSSDMLIQMGVIGVDGYVVASNLGGPVISPVYLGDGRISARMPTAIRVR